METSRTYFGSGADWARCIARRTHARRCVNRRSNPDNSRCEGGEQGCEDS